MTHFSSVPLHTPTHHRKPRAVGSCSLVLLLLAGAQAAHAQKADSATEKTIPADKPAAVTNPQLPSAEDQKVQGKPEHPADGKPTALSTQQQIQLLDEQIRVLEERRAALLGTQKGGQEGRTQSRPTALQKAPATFRLDAMG